MSVAIVGMAGVFPDAPDPETLWQNVLWRRRAFVAKGPADTADRVAPVEGLEIPEGADPASHLAVSVAGQAIADASGLDTGRVDRGRVKVVMGVTGDPLAGLLGGPADRVAGAVCERFAFHGGGHDLPAGSAASLLAVITACRALRDDAADLALAGGVDLDLERPDDHWPGQGCGMVALMRADEAAARGIRVHAEIAGWGVASSGGEGIMERSIPEGQLLALRRAYAHADVRPGDVALFEGHGASPGDAADLTALVELLADGRPYPAGRPAIGTVKANAGHTGAASGVAGLIKAALSVSNGVLPPASCTGRHHDLLTGHDAPVRLLAAPESWPAGPRHAGVSAMAGEGVHAHVVIRDRPSDRPLRNGRAHPVRTHETPRAKTWRMPSAAEPLVFAVSGADMRAVRPILSRIAAQAGHWSEAELHDLACGLAALPPDGPLRVAITAGTSGELAERAQRAAERTDLAVGRLHEQPGVYLGMSVRGRVTLLFPGQGAPVRRPEELGTAPADTSCGARVADTAVAQPAIMDASLVALGELDRLGLNAGAAIGHSIGELTAMVWAGCVSVREARRLIRRRGQIMSELGSPGTGMVSVTADREQAELLAAGTGMVIAAQNGPAVHVLSGRENEVAAIAKRAADVGLEAIVLPVSRAFHSPHVAACVEPFEECLRDIEFTSPERTLISTVTGHPVGRLDDLAMLLRAQILAPVRFWDAVGRVAGVTDLFCEAGPGHGLAALVAATGVPSVSADTYGPDGVAAARTAAALWVCGGLPDLSALYGDRPSRPMDIWRDRVFIGG
ncbi:acyltransferase domain-containing protein [Spongiactinospora sp. TRM90649]|uniref:acyltransferase domain-containing protein n=1 Tax=Spongiactinospora sp. TRM90649 TaxID=3031114 RepID=UPI0023F62E53|nr:acyltransferase domain-containing protein [Spongiactinospora sp. TRM90649]MDF5756426.1 acyltransferase domain-containing protein [Spongiactinospora sp. TRM90649]